MRSVKNRQKMRGWLMTMGMLLLSLIFLFPLYAIFIASLKPGADLMRHGLNVNWEPASMSLKNYRYLFSAECDYFYWFRNSILLTVLQTTLILLLTSIVGYALAMYDFKGKNIVFLMVLLLMMIPVEIIILPLYQMMIKAGLLNTYTAVVLPSLVTPVSVFFFRQYTLGLSREFLLAARVDGCSDYGIMFRIYFPVMLPAFGAMTILQWLNSWNNFLWPLIVLHDGKKFTLPLGLSSLLSPLGNNYDILVAGSVMSILPVVILFLMFQRSFISGLTVGGVKE